jgi:hypothetical protein
MEMNKTGQNCEEKADHQVIEKNEQRRVNDSNCCRRCNHVPQKAFTHSLPDLSWHRLWPRSFRRHLIVGAE